MSKLFVTDMDGTLLDSRKELPAAFETMVKEIQKDGSYLAFASGRSYIGLNEMYGQYSDDFGYICDNGGMVVFHEEVLKMEPLTKENLLEIQALLELNSRLCLAFCGTGHVYLMHPEPLDESQQKELAFYYPVCRTIQSIEEIEEDIIKAALLYGDDIQKNILPLMHLDKSLTYPVTAYNWIDIFRANLSKGEGIASLQKKLNISPEDTYVFGDYYNDLSMAAFAGHSYAMGNAIPEVKDLFTDEIGTNEEGAVAEKILEILQNQ